VKTVIISLVILILLITMIFVSTEHTKSSLAELEAIVTRLEAAASAQNLADARDCFGQLNERWDKAVKTFSYFFNHHELEGIRKSLAVLDAQIKNENFDGIAVEISTLKSEFFNLSSFDLVCGHNLF